MAEFHLMLKQIHLGIGKAGYHKLFTSGVNRAWSGSVGGMTNVTIYLSVDLQWLK